MAEQVDSNSLSAYEYIAATNPLKAINYLKSKGIQTTMSGAMAKHGLKNLAYKNLLILLVDPKEPVPNKEAAFKTIKDIAGNLRRTVTDDRSLYELFAKLHPDSSAFGRMKKNADGTYSADGANCVGCNGDKVNCCADGDTPAPAPLPATPTASLDQIGKEISAETTKLVNMQINTTYLLIGAIVVIGIFAFTSKSSS